MRSSKVLGTFAAAAAGGAVVAGGSAANALSPPLAATAGALVATALAYALGDRQLPVLAAVFLYLGVGGAVVGDVLATPVSTGHAFVAVGAALLVAFLVRWRTGNTRRLATLPIDPGVRRRVLARIARPTLALQSVLGRVADVSVGRLRVGTVVLTAAWGGLVAGLVVASGALSAPTGTVAQAGLLATLVVPFYLGTDWTAVDDPRPDEGKGVETRLLAVAGAFVDGDTEPTDATGDADGGGDPDGGSTPLYRGGRDPYSDADAERDHDRLPTRRPEDRRSPQDDGDPQSADDDSRSNRPESRILADEEEVQDLRPVGEMGPASLAGGDGVEDDEDDEDDEASVDGDRDGVEGDADETTPNELGVLDRVTKLLEGEDPDGGGEREDGTLDDVDWEDPGGSDGE